MLFLVLLLLKRSFGPSHGQDRKLSSPQRRSSGRSKLAILRYLTHYLSIKHPSNPLQPAGYVRQTGNFVQVVIRDAGHMVPTDQPERAYDMISRFIEGTPFTN